MYFLPRHHSGVKSTLLETSVGVAPNRVPPAAHIMCGYGAHDGTVPIADTGRERDDSVAFDVPGSLARRLRGEARLHG